MVKVNFQKGQTIFYKGHLPYGIYIFKSGKVRLVVGECSDKCVEAPSNMCIGLDSVLSGEVLPFTAVAGSKVEGYFICKAAIEKYLGQFEERHFRNVN